MKRQMMRLLAPLSLVAMTLGGGCVLYFGEDDPPPCEEVWGEDDILYASYFNPSTAECEDLGWSGYPGCGDVPASAGPIPDWALCESACTGLDEGICTVTDGCRGIYVGTCPEGAVCDSTSYAFAQCVAIAPSGPVDGPTHECDALDAYACSQRDRCVARHYPRPVCDGNDCVASYAAPGNFESCAPEPSVQPEPCASDEQCGDGMYCTTRDGDCQAPPGCDQDGGCEAVCYGTCVPETASCFGEVSCDSLPPQCPVNTVPEVAAGCWTGQCVPLSACPVEPTCEEIGLEAQCVDRDDCDAIYQGEDCTCDAQGCSCQSWLFSECVTRT